MKNLRKILMPGFGSLIGIILAVGLGALLMLDSRVLPFLGKFAVVGDRIGRRLSYLSYEVLFATRKYDDPQEAVLVYVDDPSYQKLNQSYDRLWDRSLYAQLIEKLKAEGAKSVTLDVVFSNPSANPEADQRLAKAIKDFGNVVLAADWVLQRTGSTLGRVTIPPNDMFAEGAANIGISEMAPDPDMFVRRHFAGAWGEPVSTLSWATAELWKAGITKDEKLKFTPRWINYYGPPGQLPHVSFFQALSDDPEIRPPPNFFKGKAVFVGSRILTYKATERKDEYKSPYTFWTESESGSHPYMAGVEIHATTFLNLIRGDWLNQVAFKVDLLLVLAAGLIFGFALPQFRPDYAALVSIAAAGLISFAAYYCFIHQRVWFSWLVIVGIQIPAAALWAVLFNSINLYVQKKLVERSLSMYVSASRVKQILKNKEMLRPGAEKQTVSILFSDIASFTSLSEGMDSDELAHLMNRYFETTVDQCVHPAEGTVIKFIGDAIFAIWNAPEPQMNHQELACQGALLLKNHATSFMFKPGLQVQTRVGLHCGEANVGNFGSPTRIDYTALGENINLASRMEGLNKYLGTDVLITGQIHAAVKGKFTTRFCGVFQLKGFEKAVEVHELVDAADRAEVSRNWREQYGQALDHFRNKNFDAAEAGFHCVIQQHPGDGPARFMIKQIAELRTHPLDEDWDGTIELKEK